MSLRCLEALVPVVMLGCAADPLPCTRTGAESVRASARAESGYDVIIRDDGAIVADGTGPLSWRALYTAPRNCAAPGDGAGNPILLALLRNEAVELVAADGCGEELVVVSSGPAAEALARRVGAFLESHRLRERVAIFVGCDTRSGAAPGHARR